MSDEPEEQLHATADEMPDEELGPIKPGSTPVRLPRTLFHLVQFRRALQGYGVKALITVGQQGDDLWRAVLWRIPEQVRAGDVETSIQRLPVATEHTLEYASREDLQETLRKLIPSDFQWYQAVAGDTDITGAWAL